MKNEDSTLGKKIKQYSALAGSLFAVTGVAHGQVIYTDINPDVVLSAPNESYLLDFNNDGNVDFIFQLQSKHTASASFDRAGILPYPTSAGNTNAILGTFYMSGQFIFGFPSRLAQGAPIDAGQSQFVMNDLLFTLSSMPNQFVQPAFLSIRSSSSYGKWQGGIPDQYVGLKFSDGTNTFFGWVRLDVSAHADSMTIKDYAYNPTPNGSLFAGQGDPTGIGTVNQNSNLNIFGYEGVANIFVNEGKLDGASVTVTNMLGQTMVKQGLSNRATHIDLNQFGKGIYLVTVQRGEEVFSKKVSFR